MYLGIDIGGTKTEMCLISSFKDKLEIVFRDRRPTQADNTFTGYFDRLRELLRKNLDKNKISAAQIQSIGVGLPGAVQHSKMVQGSIPFLKGIDLQEAFSAWISPLVPNFSGSFNFENDANCFVLAEYLFGAGKNQTNIVGITLGTGVGGGIIINGKLYAGSRGGAAELGHIEVIKNGRECYCGNFGCAEQYLSGKALEFFYNSHSSGNVQVTAHEIFQLSSKNEIASKVVSEYRKILARFLADVINMLDPSLIVLGGGVSSEKQIYSGLNELVKDSSFIKPAPPIVQNELGGSAGVIGAAYLGFNERGFV